MEAERVVLVGREEDSTHILYHALATQYNTSLIYEESPSRLRTVLLRAKRLGWGRVLGQVLFQVLIAGPMYRISSTRRDAIIRQAGASTEPPDGTVARTPSVNSENLLDKLRELSPQVVVINGTRILSARTLGALKVPVLNTHAGITPRYRGVHGAYWALVNRDPDHCGVTVHLVDAGIDTGAILYQETITPAALDNFTTYPLMQVVAGSRLLCKAVEDVLHDRVRSIQGPAGSVRWYHPTLWQYLYRRMVQGVR
ncbi:MAG: hypothetical protein KBF80_07615 [Flavobacteriales bacterium]|nr:hypothetical protein [Flavobacteriales bacterium]